MDEDFDKTENSKFKIPKKKAQQNKQQPIKAFLFERSNRFQPFVNEEEFNYDCSSISNDENNNGNNGKTVNDEDDLDESLQQGSCAGFKKKKTSIRPKNMAIFGISGVNHLISYQMKKTKPLKDQNIAVQCFPGPLQISWSIIYNL